jgi:hypothetical protein
VLRSAEVGNRSVALTSFVLFEAFFPLKFENMGDVRMLWVSPGYSDQTIWLRWWGSGLVSDCAQVR